MPAPNNLGEDKDMSVQVQGPGVPEAATPKASASRPAAAGHASAIYAAEVVGRRVGVSKGSKGACTRWEEATLTGFDPATGLHMLKYSAGTEEEVALGPGTRFKWLDEVPEGTEPNPSYASGPKGQEAVGRRIKVYWSGMGRWYSGVVRSYDPESDMHLIAYKDGDSLDHVLRHEAVRWPDSEVTSSPEKSTPVAATRNHLSHPFHLPNSGSTSGAGKPASGSGVNGSAAKAGSLLSFAAATPDPLLAAPLRGSREGPASAACTSSTAGTPRGAAAGRGAAVALAAAAASPAGVGVGGGAVTPEAAGGVGPSGRSTLPGTAAGSPAPASTPSMLKSQPLASASAAAALPGTARGPPLTGAPAWQQQQQQQPPGTPGGMGPGAVMLGTVPVRPATISSATVSRRSLAPVDPLRLPPVVGKRPLPGESFSMGGKGPMLPPASPCPTPGRDSAMQAQGSHSQGQGQGRAMQAQAGHHARGSTQPFKQRRLASALPLQGGSTTAGTAVTAPVAGQQAAPRGGGQLHGAGAGAAAVTGAGAAAGASRPVPTVPSRPAPPLETCLLALGTRVELWSQEDESFHRAKLVDLQPHSPGTFRAKADDGTQAWVALSSEPWRWLGPRGSSAGYTPELHAAMAALGACNIGPVPQPAPALPPALVAPFGGSSSAINGASARPQGAPAPAVPVAVGAAGAAVGAGARQGGLAAPAPPSSFSFSQGTATQQGQGAAPQGQSPSQGPLQTASVLPEAGEPPSTAKQAVGRRLQLYWRADGRWHAGEVLSHSVASGKHHVLFLDGEDEWLDLSQEVVVWSPPLGRGCHAPPCGLPAGTPAPTKHAAVGWRVGVYWRGDATLYEGRITTYDVVTGEHKVVYDDGEEEMFHLGSEKVVWRVYAPQQQQQNQSQPASQPSSPNKGQAGNSSSGVFKAGNMAGASRASCSGGGRGAAGSRGAGSGSGGGRASYRGGLLDDPMDVDCDGPGPLSHRGERRTGTGAAAGGGSAAAAFAEFDHEDDEDLHARKKVFNPHGAAAFAAWLREVRGHMGLGPALAMLTSYDPQLAHPSVLRSSLPAQPPLPAANPPATVISRTVPATTPAAQAICPPATTPDPGAAEQGAAQADEAGAGTPEVAPEPAGVPVEAAAAAAPQAQGTSDGAAPEGACNLGMSPQCMQVLQALVQRRALLQAMAARVEHLEHRWFDDPKESAEVSFRPASGDGSGAHPGAGSGAGGNSSSGRVPMGPPPPPQHLRSPSPATGTAGAGSAGAAAPAPASVQAAGAAQRPLSPAPSSAALPPRPPSSSRSTTPAPVAAEPKAAATPPAAAAATAACSADASTGSADAKAGDAATGATEEAVTAVISLQQPNKEKEKEEGCKVGSKRVREAAAGAGAGSETEAVTPAERSDSPGLTKAAKTGPDADAGSAAKQGPAEEPAAGGCAPAATTATTTTSDKSETLAAEQAGRGSGSGSGAVTIPGSGSGSGSAAGSDASGATGAVLAKSLCPSPCPCPAPSSPQPEGSSGGEPRAATPACDLVSAQSYLA